ncbi:glycosyltransferase family 4 protein [Actinomycetospora endophytica]|uniref:Glycosyltransferase family 4 protein n=1 Tax=Actinomycetospora endophytica TaxID=2291215 RepID=A0ABS8P2B0_9PSEU|nr:glycosyltransferase family 4 protein [Actinomycetospora endophytica]MCD2192385.1 glycosyltransferase family 4 protein [Actinomycetospora endophytica]
MRVLWLSPWLRTLTRVQVDALRDAGHSALVVTTDQHYEKVTARPDERVLDPAIKDPRTLPALARVIAEARRFAPDVVVSEMMHDPRWLPMTRLAPLVQVVHDDRPHDHHEERPWHQRAVLDHQTRSAAGVVAPSAHVAAVLSARFGRRVDVVPLTSDVPEADLPPVPVAADERRDMVLLGRMSPYKNVEVALQAWAAHTASSSYAGDRLLLLGNGPLESLTLPEHVEWRREHFSYADVLPRLARAKASLAHYRLATQSGVQVLSMQLGVPTIVSDSGGLPEFAAPEVPPLGVDDVSGLAETFGRLADPATAARLGAGAREHYERRFSADRAAAAWVEVFARVTGRPALRGV